MGEEPHVIRLCLQMMCRDNSHTCCDFNIKTGRPARSLLSEETSLIGSVGLRFERRGGGSYHHRLMTNAEVSLTWKHCLTDSQKVKGVTACRLRPGNSQSTLFYRQWWRSSLQFYKYHITKKTLSVSVSFWESRKQNFDVFNLLF